jgi:hypothetical protein
MIIFLLKVPQKINRAKAIDRQSKNQVKHQRASLSRQLVVLFTFQYFYSCWQFISLASNSEKI